MFEFSVNKDMKKWYNKGGDNREGIGTIMSNTNWKLVLSRIRW